MDENNDRQDECNRALAQSFQKISDGTAYMIVQLIVAGLTEIELDEPTMKKVVRLVIDSGTTVAARFNANILEWLDSADDDFDEDEDDEDDEDEDEDDDGDYLDDDYIDEDGSSGAKIKFVYE